MARLVSWPEGLRANFREPLSGPRAVGSGATGSIGNFTQTFASPFGLWRWRFQFPPIRGQLFRRYRGWITALHGGANATRVSFCDWDGLTRDQVGVDASQAEWRDGQPWSNGQSWSNGQNWQSSPPVVAVAAPTALGGTVVNLAAEYWGHTLGVGDFLGFFPLHFGLYMVTEVLDEGRYRVWPPLRKAVTTADSATLRPVMAMKLESEDAANAPRGAAFADGLSVTLTEVLDYDVKSYFAGVTMAIFTQDELALLSAPHVARAWFLELDLPDGLMRLHNGVGRITVGGQEWSGVTNPLGGQMVSLSNVEEPRFGQAVAVNITLSGANKAFLQSVHATRREIEGRRADLFWAAFDGETGELLLGPKRLFPGKITSPVIHWQGIGTRLVNVTIESIWSSQNYPFGGRWNDADQRRRYPGDKGMQYVGVRVQEQWK